MNRTWVIVVKVIFDDILIHVSCISTYSVVVAYAQVVYLLVKCVGNERRYYVYYIYMYVYKTNRVYGHIKYDDRLL